MGLMEVAMVKCRLCGCCARATRGFGGQSGGYYTVHSTELKWSAETVHDDPRRNCRYTDFEMGLVKVIVVKND